MRWIGAVLVAVVACGHGSPSPRTGEPTPEPETTERPAGAGPLRTGDPITDCVPRGPELTLEGTIVVQPFGKGTNGAILQTGTDEWVLAYRAEGELLALDGQRVTAHGRECAKGGQAVYGKHFDYTALTPVSAAGRPRTPRTPGGRA